jgi:hypothetical protein
MNPAAHTTPLRLSVVSGEKMSLFADLDKGESRNWKLENRKSPIPNGPMAQ